MLWAAELGAQRFAERAGLEKPQITRSKANKLYGRRKIDRMVNAGLIHIHGGGDRNQTQYIDSLELMAAIKAIEAEQ